MTHLALLHRLHAAWEQAPGMTLGALLVGAAWEVREPLHTVSDARLVELVEEYVERMSEETRV